MQKSSVPHLESRIFGLRDYPDAALEEADAEQSLEELFFNPGDDERIGEEDVDEVLRDFDVTFDEED